MPTDTTIIEQLRVEAERFGTPAWGNGEDAAQLLARAADALTAAHAALANLPGHTCHVSGDDCGGCEYARERDARIAAAHAARDAAEREITDRIAQSIVDGTRASVRVNGLDDAIKLVRDVADGGRSWRDTAAREHAKLATALRERDEARQELARYQAEHAKRRP